MTYPHKYHLYSWKLLLVNVKMDPVSAVSILTVSEWLWGANKSHTWLAPTSCMHKKHHIVTHSHITTNFRQYTKLPSWSKVLLVLLSRYKFNKYKSFNTAFTPSCMKSTTCTILCWLPYGPNCSYKIPFKESWSCRQLWPQTIKKLYSNTSGTQRDILFHPLSEKNVYLTHINLLVISKRLNFRTLN
jgi:hypothetical protein